MTPARISIITPCYTAERFKDIVELLYSVQDQTYKNIDTLVVAERSPELADSIRKHIMDRDFTPTCGCCIMRGRGGSLPPVT